MQKKNSVVEIGETPKESGEYVVERLEEALGMAKKGLVANVFIAAHCTDGSVTTGWANTTYPFSVVGIAEYGLTKFKNNAIEENSEIK